MAIKNYPGRGKFSRERFKKREALIHAEKEAAAEQARLDSRERLRREMEGLKAEGLSGRQARLARARAHEKMKTAGQEGRNGKGWGGGRNEKEGKKHSRRTRSAKGLLIDGEAYLAKILGTPNGALSGLKEPSAKSAAEPPQELTANGHNLRQKGEAKEGSGKSTKSQRYFSTGSPGQPKSPGSTKKKEKRGAGPEDAQDPVRGLAEGSGAPSLRGSGASGPAVPAPWVIDTKPQAARDSTKVSFAGGESRAITTPDDGKDGAEVAGGRGEALAQARASDGVRRENEGMGGQENAEGKEGHERTAKGEGERGGKRRKGSKEDVKEEGRDSSKQKQGGKSMAHTEGQLARDRGECVPRSGAGSEQKRLLQDGRREEAGAEPSAEPTEHGAAKGATETHEAGVEGGGAAKHKRKKAKAGAAPREDEPQSGVAPSEWQKEEVLRKNETDKARATVHHGAESSARMESKAQGSPAPKQAMAGSQPASSRQGNGKQSNAGDSDSSSSSDDEEERTRLAAVASMTQAILQSSSASAPRRKARRGRKSTEASRERAKRRRDGGEEGDETGDSSDASDGSGEDAGQSGRAQGAAKLKYFQIRAQDLLHSYLDKLYCTVGEGGDADALEASARSREGKERKRQKKKAHEGALPNGDSADGLEARARGSGVSLFQGCPKVVSITN